MLLRSLLNLEGGLGRLLSSIWVLTIMVLLALGIDVVFGMNCLSKFLTICETPWVKVNRPFSNLVVACESGWRVVFPVAILADLCPKVAYAETANASYCCSRCC